MKKIHVLAVAVLLGVAAIFGVVAATRTVGVGAAAHAPISQTALTERAKRLNAAERALRRALNDRPPALPAVPAAAGRRRPLRPSTAGRLLLSSSRTGRLIPSTKRSTRQSTRPGRAMTSHVGRLYALAIALLVFFMTWAAVAARPWAPSSTSDPRLQAIAAREQQVRAESVAVRHLVNQRWTVYRKQLKCARVRSRQRSTRSSSLQPHRPSESSPCRR